MPIYLVDLEECTRSAEFSGYQQVHAAVETAIAVTDPLGGDGTELSSSAGSPPVTGERKRGPTGLARARPAAAVGVALFECMIMYMSLQTDRTSSACTRECAPFAGPFGVLTRRNYEKRFCSFTSPFRLFSDGIMLIKFDQSHSIEE